MDRALFYRLSRCCCCRFFIPYMISSHEVNDRHSSEESSGGEKTKKGKQFHSSFLFVEKKLQSDEVSLPVGVFEVGLIGEPLSCPETFCLGR